MRFLSLTALLIFEFFQRSSSGCSEPGVFPNPNDDSCHTYKFCFRLPDGVFIEKLYTCPNGTLFNPLKNTCIPNYNCILAPIPTTTEGPKNSECTTQGRFSEKGDVTCSRYFFCYYLPSGEYFRMNYSCPVGTQFDPGLQTCSSKFSCNVATTTTTVAPNSYNCTKQGRFPDEEDTTCRSYHYCLYLPYGSYTEQTYSCPSVLKFDPKTQSCSPNYQCSITTVPSTTRSNNFVCPSTGRFPDDADTFCKTYFYCVKFPNGDIGFLTYKCPEDLNFDPKLQICSGSYSCSATKNIYTTTFSILTTSSAEKTTTEYRDLTTTSQIPTDLIISTTKQTGITDHSKGITDASTRITDHPSGITEISTSTSPHITTESKNDICESVGRFPDSTKGNCEAYFLCAMGPDGKLISFKYICESGELFDPDLKKCSASYRCDGDIRSTPDG